MAMLRWWLLSMASSSFVVVVDNEILLLLGNWNTLAERGMEPLPSYTFA
jgi:hypothetical protein